MKWFCRVYIFVLNTAYKCINLCACFDMIYCAWIKTDSVALLAHVYHISYFPYFMYDTCFLKPFHVKFYFSFYQTKGISHEKQMQKFLFFLYFYYFLKNIDSEKLLLLLALWVWSISELCMGDIGLNLFQLLHSLHINCLSLKGILGSAWNTSEWFKKRL